MGKLTAGVSSAAHTGSVGWNTAVSLCCAVAGSWSHDCAGMTSRTSLDVNITFIDMFSNKLLAESDFKPRPRPRPLGTAAILVCTSAAGSASAAVEGMVAQEGRLVAAAELLVVEEDR